MNRIQNMLLPLISSLAITYAIYAKYYISVFSYVSYCGPEYTGIFGICPSTSLKAYALTTGFYLVIFILVFILASLVLKKFSLLIGSPSTRG